MNSILDDVLVRKYFGCEVEVCEKLHTVDHDWLNCLSRKVISAMEEPIRNGDKTLCLWSGTQIEELKTMYSDIPDRFHPRYLRLPSKFQEAGKKYVEIDDHGHCRCRIPVDPSLHSNCCYCQEKENQPTPKLNIKPSTTFMPAPEKCACGLTRNHVVCKPSEAGKCDEVERCCDRHATQTGGLCDSEKAVEAKIKEVLDDAGFSENGSFHHRLKELVALARGSK